MTDPRVQAQLAARFEDGEVRQFTGRGGQTFDYIEDETVMDRLDEVLGIGEWYITVEPISVADGIVKVTLVAFGKPYEDFGYASNAGPQAESLKEAVSDGIRRCGRYLGVGRYLYKKHPVISGGREASSARPAAPIAPTNGHRADTPSGPAARTSAAMPEFPTNEWETAPAKSNETMWSKTLFELAESKGVDKKRLGAEAKRLFGQDKWKVTELSDEERYVLATEMGLVG